MSTGWSTEPMTKRSRSSRRATTTATTDLLAACAGRELGYRLGQGFPPVQAPVGCSRAGHGTDLVSQPRVPRIAVPAGVPVHRLAERRDRHVRLEEHDSR